jgi:hypothetical protein
MYTIADTIEEIRNGGDWMIESSHRWINVETNREAFIWKAIAEKRGVEFEMDIVRFYENSEWIDTWYPGDRATAERLATEWCKGSTEVTDRHALIAC